MDLIVKKRESNECSSKEVAHCFLPSTEARGAELRLSQKRDGSDSGFSNKAIYFAAHSGSFGFGAIAEN